MSNLSNFLIFLLFFTTTTQTEVDSKYECPDYFYPAIVSEDVTYIIDTKWNLYKIQNQRVVKKGPIDDFFVELNYSSPRIDAAHDTPRIDAGYIRNGSLILLEHTCCFGKSQVLVYDPIPMQTDKFKLREGFPKETPIDMFIDGAIVINDEVYVFGYDDYYMSINSVKKYVIFDEQFNNATTKMDLKIDFPNFPLEYPHRWVEGGHTSSFNGQKFLTIFTSNRIDLEKSTILDDNTTIITNDDYSWYSQVYTYDLEGKNLVGGGKNLTEYLLNCE